MATQDQAKIYIETKTRIKDPIKVEAHDISRATYQRIFDEDPTAEALWVLLPGQREPFRFAWRNLFQRFQRGPKKPNKGGRSSRREAQS